MESNEFSPPDAGSSKPKTGHGPLKWGTFATLAGYAFVFIANILYSGGFADVFGILGILMLFGGLITWVTGLTQRLIYNKRWSNALPFTTGEKFSLIGAALLLVGILLVNGTFDESGTAMARLIAIVGVIGTLAGVVWHLLTPRSRTIVTSTKD
jgi:hypothetical protein